MCVHVLYICLSEHMYVYQLCIGAQGSQKRVSDPPELELHMVVSHLMWVVGTEL